ncbi:hypothetical protein [Solimonas variicoloris]|uniref:hypothetical protein n=1 Tax=Solimonas variicoloris TaxID=254408 RepID=UPI000382EDAC|nr:hypothetical protein [Solimonas variicoloris]
MRPLLRRLAVVLFLASLQACGGGGGGDSSGEPPAATPAPSLDTTLAGYPQAYDVYDPGNATRAVVFLHGGMGDKASFAYKLGLLTQSGTPSSATVNWNWLAAHRVLAVFPQGQHRADAPKATTWSNYVMDSGADDRAFLAALSSTLASRSGIAAVHYVGHSNGGMMVNRLWCEAPRAASVYVALAGPASEHFLASATPCAPSLQRPYLGIVGAQDDVLQAKGHWSDPTWTITPVLADTPAFLDPVLIGEWAQFQSRVAAVCGESPTLAGAVTVDQTEIWTHCGGRLEVRRPLQLDHSLGLPEANGGTSLLDTVVDFIDAQSAP